MFDDQEHESLIAAYELWSRRKAQALALGNDQAAEYAEHQADKASRAIYEYIWAVMGGKSSLWNIPRKVTE